MSLIGSNNKTVTAPPVAKKAKFLRDADGNLYLWTPELAQRGDLVAAYDPSQPEKFAADQAKIALVRELEMARERADAEEVARLEAVRAAEVAEASRKEAEEVAEANARNLQIAEETLQAEREANAREKAELQAKIDAMAKEMADKVKVEPQAKKTAPKKPMPKKINKNQLTDEAEVVEEGKKVAASDLTDFEQ